MILIDEPPVTMLCSVVSASVIVVYIVIDVRLDDVHACMSGRRTSIYKVVKVRLRARTDVCFCEMIFVNFCQHCVVASNAGSDLVRLNVIQQHFYSEY